MNFTERYASHVRLAVLLSLIEAPADDRARLAILMILARAPGRAANVSLITDMLPDHGVDAVRDGVAAHVAFLERSRLVVTRRDGGVPGAMILDLGADVAAGLVGVPGVAPTPTREWLQATLDGRSLRISLGDLDATLEWLVGLRLVTIDGLAVTITRRGRDVVLGREMIQGIKSPSAEAIMRMAARSAVDRLGG